MSTADTRGSAASGSDPCNNYTSLDEYWRDIQPKYNNINTHDDTLVEWSGWYRLYLFGKSAQMSEWCVSTTHCGGETGLSLNGSHPRIEDGVVTRKVVGTNAWWWLWSSSSCGSYKSTSIRVKACPGDYYVYEFVKPNASIPKPTYCAVAFQNISSDPCYNYESLDRPWRTNNESEDRICDRFFSWNGWYRFFYYGMNIQMPETCVGSYRCNTQITLYLNGPHPRIEDGVVTREVCGGTYGTRCCEYRTRPIRVKACPGNYYVYELVNPDAWCAGYCTNISTVSQPVPTISPTIITGSNNLNYDPCNNYNTLNNYWRNILDYGHQYGLNSDYDDTRVSWDGWYRLYINGLSAKMPEWCVSNLACGGFSSLWLAGSHPQLGDGVVTRDIYGSHFEECRYYRSNPIQVKACPGNYYVYKFTRPPLSIPAPVYCAVRFTTPSVDPCFNYKSLDEPWRATNNPYDSNYRRCDNFQGWYRLFYNGQSVQMPESCVNQYMCGTYIPMWLNGSHPQLGDGVVTRQICGSTWTGCCTLKSLPIQVKACPGNYYVYEFVSPIFCGAYCAGENFTNTTTRTATTSITTPFTTTVLFITPSVDPCYNYNTLDEPRRSTSNSYYYGMCDYNVKWNGWYRLFIRGQNAQMPESCVNQNMCGTEEPFWLNGSHPQLEDGVVTRQVCVSSWRGCCGYTSHPIQVKACPGSYYVYEFVRPMFCGVYCASECHRLFDNSNTSNTNNSNNIKNTNNNTKNSINNSINKNCNNTINNSSNNNTKNSINSNININKNCNNTINNSNNKNCNNTINNSNNKNCNNTINNSSNNNTKNSINSNININKNCNNTINNSNNKNCNNTVNNSNNNNTKNSINSNINININKNCNNTINNSNNNNTKNSINSNSNINININKNCNNTINNSNNKNCNNTVNNSNNNNTKNSINSNINININKNCNNTINNSNINKNCNNTISNSNINKNCNNTINNSNNKNCNNTINNSNINNTKNSINSNINININKNCNNTVNNSNNNNTKNSINSNINNTKNSINSNINININKNCNNTINNSNNKNCNNTVNNSNNNNTKNSINSNININKNCNNTINNSNINKNCNNTISNSNINKNCNNTINNSNNKNCNNTINNSNINNTKNSINSNINININKNCNNTVNNSNNNNTKNSINSNININKNCNNTINNSNINNTKNSINSNINIKINKNCNNTINNSNNKNCNNTINNSNNTKNTNNSNNNYYSTNHSHWCMWQWVIGVECEHVTGREDDGKCSPGIDRIRDRMSTSRKAYPCAVDSVKDHCSELSCSEDEHCGKKNGVYGCLCNNNTHSPNSDSFDFSETCESSSSSMSVSRCQLFEAGFSADNLHLNDPSCRGTVRNGRVEFHFDNDEHICGTNLVANGTHFIYDNFILGTPKSEGLISREKVLKLSFSCAYPQTQTLSMNVEINPLESIVHKSLPAGEGRYRVRMIPYQDDEFTQPFTGAVDAELDQEMHVEVRVEGVNSRHFALVIDTCWATPVNDPNYDLRWDLVIQECPNPDDDTVQLQQNGVSTSSRFSFSLFIFTANSTKLYLHCAVHLCLLSSNRCSTNCTSGPHWRERRSLDFHDSASISMGPLMLSEGKTDELVPEQVKVSEASCLCASLMVFLVPLMSRHFLVKSCRASSPTVETQRGFGLKSEAISPSRHGLLKALAYTGPTMEKQILIVGMGIGEQQEALYQTC
ncbi:uncharacterized protein [Chanodichthys erythropterus]|uniref:uncharacterized protein n=1 Tax=Chanodichthys erythropterus TaxID=933992 RepID=UPI00351F5786